MILDLETIKRLYLCSEIDPENLKKYPDVRFDGGEEENNEVYKDIGK